jgi:integrase/recombinase XerD
MDRQDLHLCADRWAMDPGQYAGPLIAYTEQISGIGYDVGTVIQLTGAARHFCAWLHLSGHAMDAPDDRLVESFARHRCRCGGYRPSTPLSHRYLFKVRRFVRFLADIGLVTRTRPDDTSDDRHVEAYLDWLFRHRGLSPLTVHSHRKMLRQLLPVIGTDATRYDAAGLRAAILDRRGRVGRGAMKQTTTVLRSWLRYHAAHGTCPAALVVMPSETQQSYGGATCAAVNSA